MQPWRERKFGDLRCQITVDNVATHHAKEVEKAYERAGWLLNFFPPNMTRELQVMDLVVNGPIKKRLRKFRIDNMLSYMESFRAQFFQATYQHQMIPKFAPPTPKYQDTVLQMLHMMETTFKDKKIQDSIGRSFLKVGLSKNSSGACNVYRGDKSKGKLKTEHCSSERHLSAAISEDFSLASMLVDLSSRSDSENVVFEIED